MIDILDKKDCCGCQACVQRCPRQCISLKEDNEGFLYPSVNVIQCIDCHLCEEVCPVLHQNDSRTPLDVYAAKNVDEETRLKSSSGGIFYLLAESVISQGGVVFGAKWDENWHLIHDYAETIEGLQVFLGSKYLQSEIRNTFVKASYFLKQGRLVLFSGTPCQIAGLQKFLNKSYDNLLLVDIICHGVPSPGIFGQYLKENLDLVSTFNKVDSSILSTTLSNYIEHGFSDTKAINGISFRDKTQGWKNYCFTLFVDPTYIKLNPMIASELNKHGVAMVNRIKLPSNRLGGKHFIKWKNLPKVKVVEYNNGIKLSNNVNQNIFMRGFLSHIYLRPSCHQCPARQLKGGSDITLGDFWGIGQLLKDVDDDKGTSAVIINTEKGKTALASLSSSYAIKLWRMSYTDLIKYNSSIVTSPPMNDKRDVFFAHDDLSIHQRVLVLTQLPFAQRIKRHLSSVIKRCISIGTNKLFN